MAGVWNRMLAYINRYLFSFLHITVFGVMAIVLLLHPDWILLMGENKQKVMAITSVTLPLSFCLDYLRQSTKYTWSLRMGLGLLFFVLSYLAFQNFRLPLASFNFYNLLYVIVFYVLCLSLMASAYFFTLTNQEAWNQVVYSLYSIVYALLYAMISMFGLLLILYLSSHGFGWQVMTSTYYDLGFYILVISFQLYFLYIKSDTELSPLESYPTPLLIFVTYVLFPLFVILTGVIAVIIGLLIMQSYLPDGWVGYILLSYWILGLMLFFLIFPLRQTESKYTWIRRFPDVFSMLSIPLGVLMVADILIRVRKYGYTEPRYIFFWFGILSIIMGVQYLLDRRNANLIRLGTALLVVLTILLYGGLNMNKFSNKSQNKKVIKMLDSYGLIKDELLDTAKVKSAELHEVDKTSLVSTLDYLKSKQDNSFIKILPEYQKRSQTSKLFFDYTTDPTLMALISSGTPRRAIQLAVDPALTMPYSFTVPEGARFSVLSTDQQYSNTLTHGSSVKLRYLPLSDYTISLHPYLSQITEMLNLSQKTVDDTLTYYIEQESMMQIPLKAYSASDTLAVELMLEDLLYISYEDSFSIKKLNAYLFY